MIRIAGVYIPVNKNVFISLTYIYGVGRNTALLICKKANIALHVKFFNLSSVTIEFIRNLISNMLIEGNLRFKIKNDIKRLINIGCYRGKRHKNKLPSRGQRSRTNAQTVKKKYIKQKI